jgi:hypothetical protein
MNPFKFTNQLLVALLLALAISGCEPQPDLEKERLKQQLQEAKDQNSALGFFLVVAVVIGGGIAIYALATRNYITRTPAHEVVADSFVIDAKNVIHGSSQGQTPSLLYLIGLLLELHKRKATYKCFFDANTFYALKNAQRLDHGLAYRNLCKDFPNHFVEVPGGNQADDFLLDFAHSHGPVIISNDRYRDYTDKYPWIANGNSRRVSFTVHSDIIQIYSLGIQAAVPSDLAAAVKTLRDAINVQST